MNSVSGIYETVKSDAFGLCGLLPEQLLNMTLSEFLDVRDAKYDIYLTDIKIHDRRHAEHMALFASYTTGKNHDPSDFIPDYDQKQKKKQPKSTETQLKKVQGYNAMLGGEHNG